MRKTACLLIPMALLMPCLAPAQVGTFPVLFQNLAKPQYGDDQVFLYCLGMDAGGRWCRLTPQGAMLPVNPADADAPGHLTKGGRNYAAYGFPISQAGSFRMPTHITGGRIYISLGSPMFIPIGNNSWGGPSLDNPADPNSDVIYDWYEFTYVHQQIAFGGNTTQVDQFGFPFTVRLQQTSISYDRTAGIALSREEAFNRYAGAVAPAFRPLANTYRIVAPRSSALFRAGGAQGNYLQAYIDRVWSHYAANPFQLRRLAITFSGQVAGQRLQFTRSPPGPDGAGPFFIDKPTSGDVFACAGALARQGMTTTELELGAEVCAALHRGVALNTNDWHASPAYYAGDVKNDYAMFFHQIGLGKRAYGFPYDDVNDQSTVQILPNANPPTSLTLTVQPVTGSVDIRPRARADRSRRSFLEFIPGEGRGSPRWVAGERAYLPDGRRLP